MSDSKVDTNLNDPYGIRDVQLRILDLLKQFDQFCRDNDIQYSIDGGSLLGAIRHKGFIPWDDDADVMLDRENYDKLLSVSEHNLPGDLEIIGETWVKRLTRKDNPNKAEEEECIDLFVWDNVPDSKGIRMVKHLLLKVMQGMLKRDIDYREYSFVNKIRVFGTHMLGKLFTTRRKQKWYDAVSRWGNGKQTKKINIYNTFYRLISGFAYDSAVMKELVEVVFEDTKLMAIKDSDGYLTELYGDYMQLPPEEKRIPAHRKK